MTRLLATIVCFCFSGSTPIEEGLLPPADFAPGWVLSGEDKVYPTHDLYGYINGGAELFLEFGFEELRIQDYARGEQELSLEVYRMDLPAAALGLYLARITRETPVDGLDCRHSFHPYQLTLAKGRYYALVNNFNGDADLREAMISLARDFAATVDDSEPLRLFEILPPEELIAGSERILRGGYALEPIYTFGPDDPLSLGGEQFAVLADYRGEDSESFSRIIVDFPFQQDASEAFLRLRDQLDPSYNILSSERTWFSFEDAWGRYGSADLRLTELIVKFGLTSPPRFTDDR